MQSTRRIVQPQAVNFDEIILADAMTSTIPYRCRRCHGQSTQQVL